MPGRPTKVKELMWLDPGHMGHGRGIQVRGAGKEVARLQQVPAA